MELLTRTRGFDALPWLAGAAAVGLAAALYLIFGYAPTERTMGIVQKIFYIHVPCAVVSYVAFFLCCAASALYLLKGSVTADVVARAGAETGVLFSLVTLTTGPLWARKAWGTFWTGEPRLMLFLVLMLIFAAYLVVRNFGGRTELTRRICAVLAILGVADIPLVRYAVRLWRGNHPQVITRDGGGITPEMGVALAVSFGAIALLFAALFWARIRVGLAEEDVERYYRGLARREYRVEDATAGAPA